MAKCGWDLVQIPCVLCKIPILTPRVRVAVCKGLLGDQTYTSKKARKTANLCSSWGPWREQWAGMPPQWLGFIFKTALCAGLAWGQRDYVSIHAPLSSM